MLFCKSITKFLRPYIRHELPYIINNFIAMHIRNCPKCMEKYSKLKKLERIQRHKEQQTQLREDISSYIDGELEKNNVLSLEAKIYNNEAVNFEYKNMEQASELVRNAFRQAKNNLSFDISPDVVEKIKSRTFIAGFLETLRYPLDNE